MNREPFISEIEHIIDHFRKTGREDELFEVLARHGLGKTEPEKPINSEKLINPEALALNKIAKKEGLTKKEGIFKKFVKAYKNHWYVRYSIYYVFLFFFIFLMLNAPIIINAFQGVGTKDGGYQVVSYQELETPATADSAPLDPGEVIPNQNTILLPKIGVSAPIAFLDTTNEKVIEDYLTRGVVHYAGTANPGEVGNAFITGHSSNFWWIKGDYNYIFLNLNKMAIGDQAKIYYNGKKFVYQVSNIKVVEPTDTSVLAQGSTPTLTLMTCTPAGTNWKRLIVSLDQVSPKYNKPRVVTRETIAPTELPSTDTNSTGGLILGIWDFIKSLFGVQAN